MKFRKLIYVIFILSISLTSCAQMAYESAAPGADYAGAPMEPMLAEEEYSYDTGSNGLSISNAADVVLVGRVVIKNASIGIIVDDPAAVLESIGRMAEESGGFIVNSQLYRTQTDQGLEIPGAEITVRVPAEGLVDTIDQIKAMLEDPEKDVQYENITGEDVTSEYTDLQSRLKNLEDAKVKLEEIMESAYATEDVLAVYNELTQVTEQIEVLKGKIQYYNEAARLSSIAVSIVARESIKELSIGGWQPAGVARNAIQALIDTLEFLASAAIWIGLYLFPVGLCIFIPLFLVFLGVRAIVRRRRARKEDRPKPEILATEEIHPAQGNQPGETQNK